MYNLCEQHVVRYENIIDGDRGLSMSNNIITRVQMFNTDLKSKSLICKKY